MTIPELGLKQNWKQFSLLVLVNAFVGAMVGLERSILPAIAEKEFSILASAAILSFIVTFGISKAITNYYTGALANKIGRKNLLVTGWMFALPIPLILMHADSWNWILFGNVLLGINQGLCWSSTVVMKIDLVGPKQRGLAMGLNESAGYLAVGAMALATASIASHYGLRPYPFVLGFAIVTLGLLISWLFVKDTKHHVALESKESSSKYFSNLFWETTLKDRNLSSVTQAGLINNMNDGMVWGLFPLLLANKGFELAEIGIIVAIYPAIWGLGQLISGKMADIFPKKRLLFWGMFIQALALFGMLVASLFSHFILLSALLGIGTALVYPTFLASISENTHPEQRAKSIGIFRLWRDLGYALGALMTGFIADIVSLDAGLLSIAILTLISSLIIHTRMKNN